MVNQLNDHKMLGLRSVFLRYSFASIFLAIRASQALPCGNQWFRDVSIGLQPMPHRLRFADWVPFSVPQVFAFFSNPENLPHLMPPETQTRIEHLQLIRPPSWDERFEIQHAAGIGSIIATSFRPFPFLSWRREWISVITEFEWNHHFADVQQKGPFQRWHHRHEFMAETRNGVSGTLVRDIIEYELGFGPMGALANSVFIARQMRQTFAARQQILAQLLA